MTGVLNTYFLAILPEICLVILAIILLIIDLFIGKQGKQALAWVTVVGLVLIMGVAWLFTQPADTPQLVWGNMLRVDGAAFIFRLLFLAGAALTAIFSLDNEGLSEHGEFYILLVVSTLGMSLMSAATDIIMLFLAIETTSIPLYILAGFLVKDQKSVESGMKYFLFGVTTSAVMLFGFSLLFGFTGSTQLATIADVLANGGFQQGTMIAALLLVLVGFGFKVSAFPFHFWAPDVYEGAPTPITGFLSTASKAAGFAVLFRVFFTAFPDLQANWTVIIAVLAAASMLVGNILAVAQKNIKRLLAYSSIAQAGYMLIGVAAASDLGASGTVYYLIAYLLTNIVAFGIISVVGRSVGSDEISAYAGLSRRSPALAFGLLIAFLSLGGIPPFGGFIAKLLVFGAAIKADMLWLALLGILNAVIALYYYLNVLKVVYLYRSEQEEQPLMIASSRAVTIAVCAFGVIVVGVVIAPFFGMSSAAAAAFLGI